MTCNRSARRLDAIYAETIDGISLRNWTVLIDVILARWDELCNMESTDQMISRLSWDARLEGIHGVKPRHIRLAFASINATRRRTAPRDSTQPRTERRPNTCPTSDRTR